MLRWGSALLGYLALCAGMLVIGVAAQFRLGVSGLWVSEALAIALPALIFVFASTAPAKTVLGLRAPTWGAIAIAVVASGLNQPIVSFLTWVAHESLPASLVTAFDQKQRLIESLFGAEKTPMLLAVTIGAPLGEELFFRGFAFPAFARSCGAPIAAFISGACFAFIHQDPVGFIGLMEIGILCAALRHWSGSLWPAVVAHAVNNGIAGGAFVLGYEDPNVAPPPWVLVTGAVLLVVYLVAMARVLRRPSPAEDLPPAEIRVSRAAPFVAVWVIAMGLGAAVLAGVFRPST